MPSLRTLWIRRLGIAAGLAVGLGYLPYRLYTSSSLERYFKLKAERDHLHEENLKLKMEDLKLRSELRALSDLRPGADGTRLSASAIEQAARDELGLVKPGEVVFKIEGAQ